MRRLHRMILCHLARCFYYSSYLWTADSHSFVASPYLILNFIYFIARYPHVTFHGIVLNLDCARHFRVCFF